MPDREISAEPTTATPFLTVGGVEVRHASGVVLAPERIGRDYEMRTGRPDWVEAVVAAHRADRTVVVCASVWGDPIVDGPCRVVSCTIDPRGNVRAVVEDAERRRLTITGQLP